MFTLKNTVNDVVKSDIVKKGLFFYYPKEFLNVLTPKQMDLPLEEVMQTVCMSWGQPFLAKELIESCAYAEKFADTENCDYRYIPLWKKDDGSAMIPEPQKTKDSVCLLVPKPERIADREQKPAVIAVAGGAYMNVSILNEGIQTAFELQKLGYRPFSLYYRTRPNHYPEPQKDLALAIKYVRAHAAEYGVDPNRILVSGYSAGGHLTASEALYYEEIETALMADLRETQPALAAAYEGISVKPDMVSLNYPVISMSEDMHEESMINLTGGDAALGEKLSVEKHAGVDYPKTFVWANDDDILVPPSNARRMYERLKEQGVVCCYKAYPTGGHGCSLGYGASCEGWIKEMAAFMDTK